MTTTKSIPTAQTLNHGTVTLHCEQHGTMLAYVWRTATGGRVSRYWPSEAEALRYAPA